MEKQASGLKLSSVVDSEIKQADNRYCQIPAQLPIIVLGGDLIQGKSLLKNVFQW